MKVINIRLSDELEARIRKFTSRKGDLSRLACEALGMWLAMHEPQGIFAEAPDKNLTEATITEVRSPVPDVV